MAKKKQNQKIIKPPELPPEVPDDEIEVSDEDVEFFRENKDYAGFISRIDTSSINKHVSRVADVEELYEKRKKSQKQEDEANELQVDPVDALPVKINGQVVYRKLSDISEKPQGEKEDGNDAEATAGESGSVLRLTKAEKRAKLKKSKKAAKQQAAEVGGVVEEVEQTQQAAVLAEVKKDLTAEELYESKKHKLAELGIALLADPESNIKFLREMLQVCKDDDDSISKLGLLSLLAVFKDIIPGYKIRLPTEKELEMKVSKDVKKMRYYESTLLSSYKGYLQMLIMLEKQSKFQHVAVRCICTLLDAAPHFNFRESLVEAVVKNISSGDDVIRTLSCDAIKSVFRNEGKHGGEATVEAVRLIANHVKAHNCQLHPDSIEVFLSLSIDEDLGKYVQLDKENKVKGKKNKKRKNVNEPSQLQENDRKKSKRDQMSKLRDEVDADYRSASFTPNVEELRRMQSETLSAVFETYFRILKHAMSSATSSSEVDVNFGSGLSRSHPLLSPCLKGLGKFSHLIDLDYIGDLMSCLRRLAGGGADLGSISDKHLKCLTVSERLQCCIIAFKVMRSNLDALNVDLHGFFMQLYNLILEYRPGRDQGEVLAEALKIMLCDDRQHDMQKAAAFVKRLATFSLHYGSAESMAALVTLKHLLQKNVKCRNLLENDAGGGSVSGSIAKYQPYASDPNLSGALASVLWELNLLSKHYHPAISTISTNILSMRNEAHNQVYIPTTSPQQAFADLSLERESFNLKCDTRKINGKRKRGSGSADSDGQAVDADSFDEDELRKKFSSHFMVLHDFKESERLRMKLDRTTLALQLHEEYKQQKKTKKRSIKNGMKLSKVPQ